MLVHYLDYIRSLNADLKRRGLYMFDVDEENLFKRAGDLESLFYMNEKFKECGGTNFVPSIYTETPMSYLSYSIYRDYIDDWYEELNSLMAQPENAGEIEISPDSQNKFLALLNLETGESGLEDEDSAIIDSTDNSIADGQEQGFSISNFVDNLFSAQSSQPSGVLYVGDEDDSAYGDDDSEFAVEDSEYGGSDSDDFDEDEFLEPDDEFEDDFDEEGSDDFDEDSDSAEDEFLEQDDEEDYEELDEEDSDEYLEEDDSEDSDEIEEVIMDVDEDIFDNDFGFEDFLGDYDETMKLYHVLLGVEGYLNEEPFFMEDEFEDDTEVGYLHDDSYESGGIDVSDLFPDDGLEEDYLEEDEDDSDGLEEDYFDEEDSDELEDDYFEEDDELEENYFEGDNDFSDEDELEEDDDFFYSEDFDEEDDEEELEDDYLEEDDELFDKEGEESDEYELEDDYLEEDDEFFDEEGEESDEDELEDDYLEEDEELFDEDDEEELEDDYLEEDDELFDEEDEEFDDGLEEDDDFFANEDDEPFDEDEDELEDDYLEEDDELFDEDEDSDDDGLEEDDDFFADEDEEEYDFGGNEGFDDLGEDMSLDDWMGTETSETTQGSSQVSEIPAKKEYRPHETVVKADKLVSGANRLFNLGARKYDKMKSKMYGTEDK